MLSHITYGCYPSDHNMEGQVQCFMSLPAVSCLSFTWRQCATEVTLNLEDQCWKCTVLQMLQHGHLDSGRPANCCYGSRRRN